MFIYDTNWLSDVHSWPNKCKQVTDIYLLKTTKGLLKKKYLKDLAIKKN